MSSTRGAAWAEEEKLKGCSVPENGEAPRVSHPNWPGRKRKGEPEPRAGRLEPGGQEVRDPKKLKAFHMADALVLILARLNGRIIAGALCLRGRDRLYGRYWGSRIELPGLHFETCYYQGIEYCLEHGLHHFEPGAQGEHKLARGFLPTCTHSRHWLAHPIFHHAIDTWCRQDRDAVDHYHRAALLHSPFRESKP